MKREFCRIVERGRNTIPPMGSTAGERYGLFVLRHVPTGMTLYVIASDGTGFPESEGEAWEHVSVSTKSRCPTWEEMCWVKDLFFDDSEVVVQFHPAKKDYVNNHPFVLHLWKPKSSTIPMPPRVMV